MDEKSKLSKEGAKAVDNFMTEAALEIQKGSNVAKICRHVEKPTPQKDESQETMSSLLNPTTTTNWETPNLWSTLGLSTFYPQI